MRQGRVAESLVDDKVLRILRLAARVGALDGVAPAAGPPPSWSAEAVAAELRATAAAGMVLVRNEPAPDDPGADGERPGSGGPLLPLDPAGVGTVALVGPNAAVARTLGGGSATVHPPYTVSPLEGLRGALGADRVLHAQGVYSTDRPQVAAPPLVVDPDTGEAGLVVRYVDAAGGVLHAEHRRSGHVVAMGSFGPDVDGAAVAAVELHARVRAAAEGTHLVGCSGIGSFRLREGERDLLDVTLTLPEGADPAAALHPPFETVPLDLQEGQSVDVTLRYEVPGAPFAVFSLLVDPPREPADVALQRAVDCARDADVAVVVVGTTEEVESEGFDRESLALPGRQDDLVRAVAAVNPRTVVVVNSGAPVLLPWAQEVPAVLLVWFPGQEAGNALADVLLGAAEPGGRLPTTWPADEGGLPPVTPVDGVLTYDEGLFIGHRWYDREARVPRYPFGHGLGYTTWEYLGVDVVEAPEPEEERGQRPGPGAGDVVLRVRVRNTGARGGREVVQVYASREGGEVERPPRWLAGFGGVEAAPGEEAAVDVVVAARAFEHWDAATHAWAAEPGEFTLAVGRSSRDLRGTVTVVRPG